MLLVISALCLAVVPVSAQEPLAGSEADSEVQDLNGAHRVVVDTDDMKLQVDPTGLSGETEHVLAQLAALEDRLDNAQYASRAELAVMETRIDAQLLELADNVSNAGKRGSVYVRWGGQTCPQSAETVYTGVIGGSSHGSPGAAANALCLPLNPVYDDQPPSPAERTLLFGAEYQINPIAKHDHDPLCSVCVSARSYTVMIPGTNTCQPGWTVEYSGHIMAGWHDHNSATEYICMDSALDARENSGANQDGKLLYYTIGKCGSLPCPPYVNDKIITCVVCSK